MAYGAVCQGQSEWALWHMHQMGTNVNVRNGVVVYTCVQKSLTHCSTPVQSYWVRERKAVQPLNIGKPGDAACKVSRVECLATTDKPCAGAEVCHGLQQLVTGSSRLSTAQTGFTAQPCIHAKRQLIASSFTIGGDFTACRSSTSFLNFTDISKSYL